LDFRQGCASRCNTDLDPMNEIPSYEESAKLKKMFVGIAQGNSDFSILDLLSRSKTLLNSPRAKSFLQYFAPTNAAF